MKRVLLALILSTFFLTAAAQDFEIVSVESLPADMSAREEMKTDHNERQCALLRIATQNIVPERRERFVFKSDLGSEVVERASRNGEIWLWVSPGLKYLRIQHPDLGQYELRFLDYVNRVEALHTYKITINGTLAITVLEQGNGLPNQQYLVFQINPKDAVLEVDDQLWTVSEEGIARKFVDFGTYHYRIQAPNYYPESGQVTVNDPKTKKTVKVNLNPNFGWIEVKGSDAQNASVYIDNAYIGKAPCKSDALKSGEYVVRIAKEMYEPYSEHVIVRDNETLSLTPSLVADFSKITLEVDADAEIWVNEEKKGVRKWTGNMASGSYRIECRLVNHEPSVTFKDITNMMNGQTITLPSPKPIYGSLNIESTPDFASIFIDGNAIGETPYYTPEILIGPHELLITKNGYADYKDNIVISKGERKQINATLSKDMVFNVNGVSFTMKLVEGGSFLMGATTEQGGDAQSDEKPVHNVTLSGFYIGETEVTQALWEAVMGDNPSDFRGDNLPVEKVSWNDCQDFIRKLNQKTGRKFRLPTEAEWEYAARGGRNTNGYIYAGSNTLRDVAWYGQWNGNTYDNGNSGEKTHVVKTKGANELGLYDMSGNVWEWCQDWYGSDYYGQSSSMNPQGPSSGSRHVLRGGSWSGYGWNCRVSSRYLSESVRRRNVTGFRLCLSE